MQLGIKDLGISLAELAEAGVNEDSKLIESWMKIS